MREKNICPLLSLLISSLFLAVSCATAPTTEEFLDPAFSKKPLATLALLPVTYDPQYDQPIGVNLSRMIRYQVARELTRNGYEVILVGPHYGRQMTGLMNAEPSRLVELAETEADGVVLVHVNYHAGIDFYEYLSRDERFGSVEIYGDARLVGRIGLRELWRDQGRGSDFAHAGPPGSFRLQIAVSNLARNLFKTLPPRTDKP